MPSDRKLMVVASAGGHWVQLMRMRRSWEGMQVVFVSTDAGLEDVVRGMAEEEGNPSPEFAYVTDANLSNKIHLLIQLFATLFVVLRHRPDVIITTGAAVGYFALRFGKFLGSRTIWVDSIANAEELSKSGKEAGKYADLWLTQWEHLAKPEGPHFLGSIL